MQSVLPTLASRLPDKFDVWVDVFINVLPAYVVLHCNWTALYVQ